jgi:hypothetical protein
MLKKGVIFILSLGLCALVSGDWSFYEGPWCAKDLIDVAVGIYNGDVVIYAVNKDYSLVKSTDEGQSWTTPLPDIDIRCVTCNPNDANDVYVGCLSADGGIQYSPDGGVIWLPRNSNLPASFTPSAIAMRDAQHIVLGLDPHNYDEISIYYWDVNQWTAATFPTSEYTGFRITNLKWNPRSGLEEYIYASSDKVASGGNDNYIGVYRSENNGVNWSQIGQPDPEQPGYMMRAEALSVCCALNGCIFAGYRPEGDNPVTDVLGDPINPDKVYAAFGSGPYSFSGLGVYRNMSSGEIALWHPFNQGLTDLFSTLFVFRH